MSNTSAAENIRSFWAAKSRSNSPGPASAEAKLEEVNRMRESPTMEGLRNSLARSDSWDQPRSVQRQTIPRRVEIPSNVVSKSPFKQLDRTPSPLPRPCEEDEVTRSLPKIPSSSPTRPNTLFSGKRTNSPARSSLASPEPRHTLSRTKSVTFNESPEVREMSDCSFESGLIEESADMSDSDSDDSIDLEHTLRRHTWMNTTPSKRTLPNLEDPFDDSPRALPVPPASRPLPTVPMQRASSPVQKIMATKQEDSRKPYHGLGLQLSEDSTRLSIEESAIKYNADDTSLRSTGEQKAGMAILDSDSENDTIVQSTQLKTFDMGRVPTAKAISSSEISVPDATSKHESQVRPASPVISREDIKAKMAQRKEANELKLRQAFEPCVVLAPPLVSMEGLNTAAPDSPMSEAESPDSIKPQRKVSDIQRPATPLEQVYDSAEQPQSGRALHHVREKRLSSNVADLKTAAKILQTASDFEVISYDGDEYDNDSGTEDGKICGPNAARKSSVVSCEEVLRHLPEIPAVPTKGETTMEQEEHGHSDVESITHEETRQPGLPSMPSLSLDLDFFSFGSESLGLEEYMTPEKRPETPITSRKVVPASPVKIQDASSLSELDSWNAESHSAKVENKIDEPATITSRGMKLRTRPSLTPADASALAVRRRQISDTMSGSMVDDTSVLLDSEDEDAVLGTVRTKRTNGAMLESDALASEAQEGRIESFETDSRSLAHDQGFPVLAPLSSEMSFQDINSAFDRVMQKQTKSYVIVQKTEVVHASAEDQPSMPEKRPLVRGHTRQSSSVYTATSTISGRRRKETENFHSHHRRDSSKIPPGVTLSPKAESLPPPSPALSTLTQKLDGGRLFVKVMNVKDLTLPIPNGEESFFSCTLDNGKHCVTTPWHKLAINTMINQEFELIADHDLEFILTLQAKYEPPTIPVRPKSTFGRLLASPKKHRLTGSITSLSLAGYVGTDGSFARAHIALKHFRDKSFGRPYTMSVTVHNEWAIEMTTVPGSKTPSTRVRKPYKIGEIELQVLYVPPVEAEFQAGLPTSLGAAVRDIRDAEWHSKFLFEGYLSQQGGDCPYWRRRHFRLVGPKLTAYHINTGHMRATINLTKAVKITDDRESLVAPEVTVGRGEHKKRRKSGFAEREEGHLYVAEGFRIRFANGELIDFYADSHTEKAGWLVALNAIIGNVPQIKPWCRQVLEFEAAANPGTAV